MPMTDGEMQFFSLTLDKLLRHAARWHPRAEVVTGREDGRIDRIGYAALMERSLKVSDVLAGLGVVGGDHVATLAWNSQAHVEAWYGVMGMGVAVLLADAAWAGILGLQAQRYSGYRGDIFAGMRIPRQPAE